MLVGVAFLPPSFPPSRTQAFYIIKRQNCLNICNTVFRQNGKLLLCYFKAFLFKKMFCLNISSIKPCRLSRMKFMKINASSNSQNHRINVHDFKITRIPKLFTVCMMCKNPSHHRNTVKKQISVWASTQKLEIVKTSNLI